MKKVILAIMTIWSIPASSNEKIPVSSTVLQTETRQQIVVLDGRIHHNGGQSFTWSSDKASPLIESGEEVTLTLPIRNEPIIRVRVKKDDRQRVHAQFRFPHTAIKGMNASIKTAFKKMNVTALPLKAISSPVGKKMSIYIIKNGLAEKRDISIWRFQNGEILTLDQNLDGAVVATTGLHRLIHGQAVSEVK